jgi:uncharacterized phage-associated protein
MHEYNVIDVASYIINYSNQINRPINNLKLQKLLYYVQAAVLVKANHMCFDSKIIAWKFGPAVPEAYHYYAEYGRDDIPNQEAHKDVKLNDKTLRMSYAQPAEIDYMTQKIIRRVVDSYSNIINPLELSRKTRNEDPWKTASLNHEITCDAMQSYYARRSNLIFGQSDGKSCNAKTTIWYN